MLREIKAKLPKHRFPKMGTFPCACLLPLIHSDETHQDFILSV